MPEPRQGGFSFVAASHFQAGFEPRLPPTEQGGKRSRFLLRAPGSRGGPRRGTRGPSAAGNPAGTAILLSQLHSPSFINNTPSARRMAASHRQAGFEPRLPPTKFVSRESASTPASQISPTPVSMNSRGVIIFRPFGYSGTRAGATARRSLSPVIRKRASTATQSER